MRALLVNPVAIVALWIVAVAATIWILGPVVAYALGRRRLWVEIDAAPSSAEPGAGDADYERRYRELLALGFRPIGTTRSHARFLTPMQWRFREPEPTRWMASADDRTFFFLDRALAGEPVRLAAATFFEGGGMLYTRSPGVGTARTEMGNYVRIETYGRDPKELLSLHAEEAEAFRRERGLGVRSATLEVASSEMLAGDKLLFGTQKTAGLYAMPLALFGLPAMNAFLMLRHSPRGLALAPLILCLAALTYTVMGWGLLKVIRHQCLRESQHVDLNQKAAAPDGTIVDTGKYEAWVRRLAAFGVVHVAACGGLLLSRVPAALHRGSLSVLMLAAFLYLAWRALRSLTARAQGRADKISNEWERNQVWSDWFLVGMLSSMYADRLVFFGRVAPMLALAAGVPAVLGWWLDRVGRRKAAD